MSALHKKSRPLRGLFFSTLARLYTPAAPLPLRSSRGGRLHGHPSLRTGLAGHAYGSLDDSSLSKQRELLL